MAPEPQHSAAVTPLGKRLSKHLKCAKEVTVARHGLLSLAGLALGPHVEVLWLQGNKLAALTHLDACIRLRELYAHDNALLTLKGSLPRLRQLEVLDLAGNALRDLEKLMLALAKLPRLRALRLAGNPCCEEPRYAMRVLAALPSLELLDDRLVTDAQRREAAAAAGRKGSHPALAFGKATPELKQARGSRSGASRTAAELGRRAQRVRANRAAAESAAEEALHGANPHAAYWETPCERLPPSPGLARALDAAAELTASLQARSQLAASDGCWAGSAVWPCDVPRGRASGAGGLAQDGRHAGADQPSDAPGPRTSSGVRAAACVHTDSRLAAGGSAGTTMAASAAAPGAQQTSTTLLQQPRDVLLLQRMQPRQPEMAESCSGGGAASCSSWLRGTFGHSTAQRAWQATCETLRL